MSPPAATARRLPSASKAANEDKKWREDTTALLRNVYAQLRGVQDKDRPTDPALAKQLGFIDQISAAATQSRGSDFSLSDFTASDFRNGSFVNANFDNALFAGAVFRRAQFSRADLSDADLSGAIINSGTRLPTKR